MKKTMMAMMLLAGGLFAAPHVTVGIGIGVGAPVVVERPVCPGPGYIWMNGYWAPPAVVRVAPHFDHARIVDHRLDRFRR